MSVEKSREAPAVFKLRDGSGLHVTRGHGDAEEQGELSHPYNTCRRARLVAPAEPQHLLQPPLQLELLSRPPRCFL